MRSTGEGPATTTLATADKHITSILGDTALRRTVDDHEGDTEAHMEHGMLVVLLNRLK